LNYAKFDFPVSLNLEGSKLLLTGTWAPLNASNYGTFLLNSYRVTKLVAPVEKIRVFGASFASVIRDEYAYEIVGKSIRFSASSSICGLTTEPISNLKQTFATDIKTAALILLIRTDLTPDRTWPPGNQLAIIIARFEVK